MNKKYTIEEIEFLRTNYPKYGACYCSKILNRPAYCLYPVVKRYKIQQRTGKYLSKHPSMMNININQFLTIDKMETAYFLGFLWADGNIISYKSNKINHHRISLEINSKDMNDILPYINKLGKWCIQNRVRKDWKPVSSISTNNKELFNFLKNNDYNIKSSTTPTKILNTIPDNLKMYFWRGYFDGDGCITKKTKYNSFKFSGTYQQDWTDIQSLLKELNIINKLYRIIEKTGNKYSCVMIQNKDGVKKLINYFNPINNSIGLKRKTERMIKIINS